MNWWVFGSHRGVTEVLTSVRGSYYKSRNKLDFWGVGLGFRSTLSMNYQWTFVFVSWPWTESLVSVTSRSKFWGRYSERYLPFPLRPQSRLTGSNMSSILTIPLIARKSKPGLYVPFLCHSYGEVQWRKLYFVNLSKRQYQRSRRTFLNETPITRTIQLRYTRL